jgi:hypothetical protein
MSMPILSELLQYSPEFREKTIKRAEAVERLCDRWALAFPSRLVAAEIAAAAQKHGLLPPTINLQVLSRDWYWYPNITDGFGDIKAHMQQSLNDRIAALGPLGRSQRRAISSEVRRLDFSRGIADAAPKMAEEYGLPVEAITGSLGALLAGRISASQASRQLFSCVAEPVKFMEIYFEKVESDRDLPNWISKTGRNLQARLTELRGKFEALIAMGLASEQIRSVLAESTNSIERSVLEFGFEDVGEFGVDSAVRQKLYLEPEFANQMHACRVISSMLCAYVEQILGLMGTTSNIERSFGGDLVHSLYLPHVDLWRGDRRFAALLKRTMPGYADRVIPTLKELPAAIDFWPSRK